MTEAEAVTAMTAAYQRLTSTERADYARRIPDIFEPLERLARGARFVITYAD